ncbi:MAG: SPFH domain-containing protein [Butyricicoccus sp.]
MGLIKAAAGAGGGVLADQWKEYFYCDAINADVLAVKGRKKVTRRSSNTKGDEDIITSGSVIAVADGQAMMIVDQGKVVEAAFEPGEFVYDSSAEPTIFAGSFGDNVCKMFANMAKRFTFGGEAPRTQRVYYFNTKELTGNKYGTASPVPFRVLDERAGIDMDIGLRCFGEYSYKIVNPMLFYTNVCGNMAEEYRRENLDSQLKKRAVDRACSPPLRALVQTVCATLALPAHTMRLQTRSANSFPSSGVSCAASRSCRSASTRSRRTRRTKRPSGNAARGCLPRPDPCGRLARARAGRGDEVRGSERERRSGDGVHGHEYGRSGRWRQRAESVRNGSAAGAGGRRVDVLVRTDRQHRKILHGLRQAQARAE